MANMEAILTHKLANPITYSMPDNKTYTLNSIDFLTPTGKHINGDFYSVCSVLKTIDDNYSKVQEIVKALDGIEMQEKTSEILRFVMLFESLSKTIQQRLIEDKKQLETNIFDAFKSLFFIPNRSSAILPLAVNSDNKGHGLTIDEFNKMSLQDIFNFHKKLKDFFFSNITI